MSCWNKMRGDKIPEIIITEDGSHTIHVPELGEHYHSVHGAIQESEHIFIRSGLKTCNANPLKILEAGFGTGLNAFLTAIEASIQKRRIIYTAIEKYPLTGSVTSKLNYREFFPAEYASLFDMIHSVQWGRVEAISDYFTLNKIECDLSEFKTAEKFDLIYFDAFGPDKQPEMWTDDIFRKISEMIVMDGILITYSAKGSVRRSLKGAGFDVALLPGPLGKRHIIRAVKI